MNKRILITEPIKESVVEALRKSYIVDVGERGRFNDEEALASVIGDYDALLPMLSNPVSARVIRAADKLKIIANHAVGYNNIDVDAARDAGIKVANTPGVLSESSADLAMMLLLAVARRLNDAQAFARAGSFDGWDPLGFLGIELSGRTLGVLGMGRIGTATAHRARAFGMDIIYHNRSRADQQVEQELGARYVSSLAALASEADILTLHCPLTEETHHAIDADMLQRMPDHSLLINTSRGAVIDEAALAEALHKGTIAGAGLDVFEEEPRIHPRLLDAPGCVITPHIASATHHTRTAIGQLAANAITAVLQGRPDDEIPNIL